MHTWLFSSNSFRSIRKSVSRHQQQTKLILLRSDCSKMSAARSTNLPTLDEVCDALCAFSAQKFTADEAKTRYDNLRAYLVCALLVFFCCSLMWVVAFRKDAAGASLGIVKLAEIVSLEERRKVSDLRLEVPDRLKTWSWKCQLFFQFGNFLSTFSQIAQETSGKR